MIAISTHRYNRPEGGRVFLVIAIVAFSLVILLTISLIHGPSRRASSPKGALQLGEDDFVGKWLDVSVGNLTDGYTMDYLCNRRNISWHKNLILNVHDANGGIGNVRGNILDFIYFAISSGASILLPSFAARSASDITSLFDGRTPFESFFDEEHLITSIHSHCPEMHIYDPDQQTKMTTLADSYSPRSLRTDLMDGPSGSVEDFLTWVQDDQATLLPPKKATLVNLGRTLWDGPDTRGFSSRIRRDFGSLLKLNPDVRRLAAVATYNLANLFDINLDPTQPYYENAYMGAHLRTEGDAAQAGWLSAPHANFTAQTDAYLAQAAQKDLNIIYAASGSKEDLEAFAEKAMDEYGITVTYKHELLEDVDLAELQGLSWDQQALVDYEILLRSSYFGGFVKSSFAFNIAITRQAVLEREGRVVERRWSEIDPKRLDFQEEKAFEDAGSIIWGRDDWHEKKIPRGAWP